MRRLRVVVAAAAVVLVWQVCGMAAAQDSASETKGRVEVGPLLVCADDNGALHVFLDGEPLVAGADIECGFHGHTRASGLDQKRTERGDGTIRFSGKLPGRDVTFEERVSAVGSQVKIELLRTGEWPADGGWCSFALRLPMSRYGGATYRADGKTAVWPEEKPTDFTLGSGIRKLECKVGDSLLGLTLESSLGMSLEDDRRWGGASYAIGMGFPAGNPSKIELAITVPDATRAGPGPHLRYSPIGYPASGLKYAVLEWPKGKPRPSDAVRLERADGTVALDGRFGETINYAFMQDSFAVFDFSQVRTPGDYRVVWSGGKQAVTIRTSVFVDGLWEPALDSYIPWQMCHATVDFGGRLPALPKCHMDDGIRVPAHSPGIDGYQSYDCEGTPYAAGQAIPLTKGGWHDAGDYDLNVHAQGFTVWTLALAYEEFGIERDVATLDAEKQVFRAGRPDGVPDIVQQVEWGADWLLSVQQADGRVYVGVIDQPERYGNAVLPEKATDGIPGTGDERQVYVDYHPELQLIEAISLAASSRVLAKARSELSRKCLEAAKRAFVYFQTHPDVYRDSCYFSADPRNKGRDGMVAAAAIELYLTTHDEQYLRVVDGLSKAIGDMVIGWPSPSATGAESFWYSVPFLARLYPHLQDGELKRQIAQACQRAAEMQIGIASPRPWPIHDWDLGNFGNTSQQLSRVFDAYWLSRVVPDPSLIDDALRGMWWIFGPHPLSDIVYVCDVGYAGPKYLYSGRVEGIWGTKPASIPGALVPGPTVLAGAGMLVYRDEYNNYLHNEGGISAEGPYIFAVNALKKAGY